MPLVFVVQRYYDEVISGRGDKVDPKGPCGVATKKWPGKDFLGYSFDGGGEVHLIEYILIERSNFSIIISVASVFH